MQITTKTSYKDFLLMVEIFHLGDKELTEIFERVKDHPLPQEFDVDFDSLVFGQLCQLQQMKTVGDLFVNSFYILLKMPEAELMQHTAADCLRFIWHVKTQLERITELFSAIHYKPSPEEVRAGIEKMNHGFFGTADWYARRMGITDHEEVFQTNWMRIYKAMKIDFENNRFEQNYRKVIEQKNKR
ncbi:hypothetical protein M2132_000859 [Dysgonomonas sp. PH5-45]|uniref:hypothetical protein n=1 Tax=unclassified Dysgonomonas TaxID=2630389 RepID=UPI002473C765|nr:MULTISPECIES: hypothetical protein [unclassified Dysgonomonas]MDH6354531.1 hypothetical protein [Dysgonomonas sp. PH5-45]MDH6387413.1 hypothetical protein [Dysgonomonas sp. PH5-37]